MTVKEDQPYIDFYKFHNISPVAQDLSDLKKHFQRREYLYRRLGIVASLVKGHSVLEFGPGSGHNALFFHSLKPARHVLVDGNPTGLERCEQLFVEHFGSEQTCEFVESMIEEYQTEERFDIVLCEGLLPAQKKPQDFLKNVARFVKPGGIVVITCHDPVSYVSDLLRCLMGVVLTQEDQPLDDQVKILVKAFTPHLKHLKGMSRSYEDWVIDNVIQKALWRDSNLCSIDEAISALDGKFDVLGVSPYFIVDWRWYKDVYGEQRNFNDVARDCYYRNLHNQLDYRFVFPDRSAEDNALLYQLSHDLWKAIACFARDRKEKDLGKVIDCLEKLSKTTASFSEQTAESLNDCINVLKQYPDITPDTCWGQFEPFWGRGMQYLSFIRD